VQAPPHAQFSQDPASVSGRVGYGYRVGEVPLPVLTDIKGTASVSKIKPVDLSIRPPVMVSLGCHVDGAACPHPDPHDPMTMLAGVAKRFAIKTPEPNRELLNKLKRFVEKFVETNLVPLEPGVDTTVETWLSQTSYPKWRKDALLRKWLAVDDIRALDKRGRPKYFKCSSFMKDEVYPTYKHARGINSRSDEFKCRVGPIFRLIEKSVFKLKWFIKNIPVAERPKAIVKLWRNGGNYSATDYTAFESLFTREVMESCEFVLYEHMTKFLPEGSDFMDLVREVLGGENVCEFKNFTVFLEATRMSGEMCTSLGNGFSNLMFMLFLAEEVGCTNVDGFVEGDDGIFIMQGTPPSTELFAQLGLIIKMESHTALEHASFCGLVFDIEDQINVTNPLEVIATLGWTSMQYCNSSSRTKQQLLRCKALSFAHQYPGCPIISEMAFYILRCTSKVRVGDFIAKWRNTYEREQLLAAYRELPYNFNKIPHIEPGIRTRFLVEHLYGVSVEHQLYIEEWFKKQREIKPIDFALIKWHMKPEWVDYYEKYVHVPCLPLNRPSWIFPQVPGLQLANPFLSDVGD
jgi:hypothetical protein